MARTNPNRKLIEDLEALGYEDRGDRTPGAHITFKHKLTGKLVSFNNTKKVNDPKGILRAAEQRAKFELEPGQWQGVATLMELTGIDQGELSKVANKEIERSGFIYEKRKASKEDKERLGLSGQTRYVWRAFPAGTSKPIEPSTPTVEEGYAYVGKWDLSLNLEELLNVSRGAVTKAYNNNSTIKDYYVERRDITDEDRQKLKPKGRTKYTYRLVLREEDVEKVKARPPEEPPSVKPPVAAQLGQWLPVGPIARHLECETSQVERAANTDRRFGEYYIEGQPVSDLTDEERGVFPGNAKYAYRIVEAKPLTEDDYDGGFWSAEQLAEALGLTATTIRNAANMGAVVNDWHIRERSGQNKTRLYQASKEPFPPDAPRKHEKPLSKRKQELVEKQGDEDLEAFAIELMEENENLKQKLSKVAGHIPDDLKSRPVDDAVRELVTAGQAIKQIHDSARNHLPHHTRKLPLPDAVKQALLERKADVDASTERDALWHRCKDLEKTLAEAKTELKRANIDRLTAIEQYEACQQEMDEAFAKIPADIRDNLDLIRAVEALAETVTLFDGRTPEKLYEDGFADGQNSRTSTPPAQDDPVRQAAAQMVMDVLPPSYRALAAALLGVDSE